MCIGWIHLHLMNRSSRSQMLKNRDKWNPTWLAGWYINALSRVRTPLRYAVGMVFMLVSWSLPVVSVRFDAVVIGWYVSRVCMCVRPGGWESGKYLYGFCIVTIMTGCHYSLILLPIEGVQFSSPEIFWKFWMLVNPAFCLSTRYNTHKKLFYNRCES